jgi:hypothetical protein
MAEIQLPVRHLPEVPQFLLHAAHAMMPQSL